MTPLYLDGEIKGGVWSTHHDLTTRYPPLLTFGVDEVRQKYERDYVDGRSCGERPLEKFKVMCG